MPSAATTRAPAIASVSVVGLIPSCLSSRASYETVAPKVVPPPIETPETPGTALTRGVICSSAMRCMAPGVYGPESNTRSSGASASSSGTKLPTVGGTTPIGYSGRKSSSRSRIASRVSCTSASGWSSIVRLAVPSRDSLLVLRTPRTACAAASIGEARYISTRSGEAPGQLALI